MISQALCAYPLYVLEDVQNVVPEQVTDLFFVGSPKQLLLREPRMRIEVYVVQANHVAHPVKESRRAQDEPGEVQPW